MKRKRLSMEKAIAGLEHFSPGPAFSARVLAAVGLRAKERLPALWGRWAAGISGALVSLWTSAVLLFLARRATVPNMARALELMASPARRMVLVKLYLAKAALVFGKSMAYLGAAGRLAGPRAAPSPAQVAAAAVMAAAFMTTVSIKAPARAATRKWRTI